jgi:hypothetical protein
VNIDNFSKEQLIKYKELLEEIKITKIWRNINISYTTLSTIFFIYFSRQSQIKPSVVCALITVLGLNFISSNNREIDSANEKILKMKE